MANRLKNIGDYIQEAMASWQIPGVAVAIVQGNEVLLSAGYGVRNLETGQPVTSQTNFPIASMTKAFTAIGVALLVDEGKVTWDAPVREYLPSFRLKDSYASEHISLRDMLCHRSGLPRHDLAWYRTGISREQLVYNLRYYEPNVTFREIWQYNNLMYLTAGYTTGRVSGMTWDAFIQQRIFDPLGMTRSTLRTVDMQKTDEYSLGYRIRRERGQPDKVELMPYYEDPEPDPAGSISSNLDDLIKWLKVHLNQGRLGDYQFISPGNLAQMHRPQMIMQVNAMQEKLHGTTIAAYGMGWFIDPYRGYTLLHHGGNIDGFSLNIAFVPEANAGAIVLTNVDGRPLNSILTYEIFDRLLDLPGKDWNGRYHAVWTELEKAQDQDRDTTGDERVQKTSPSHPLADYVGEFAAQGYGDFRVKLEDDKLYGWLAGEWWSLSHYHYDIFVLDLDRFELHLKLTFQTDTRGAITSVSIPIEPSVKEVVFTRKPVVIPQETLAALVASYQTPIEGMTLMVKLKTDGKLFAQLAGETEMELVPYKADLDSAEFIVKDQPNASIAFVQEDSSWVALIKQFNSVFRATRVE